ncbi:beta-lactamase-like protein [Chytriomyces sp. MP71]|nr:beta-lactamase-like protein [Chytriomyces sp. MP71]
MSNIRFNALSGARSAQASLSHVLQIDNCRILLDCGASSDLDPIEFRLLGGMAKTIDAVLLTHADMAHLGAYVYAFARLGLTCPCYATYPVHDLGKLCMREAMANRRGAVEFNLFGWDDINAAFANVTQLRYSQPFTLSGKGKGITITAFQAGHSLGGSIWKIKKGTDDILYAVDYNHQLERHLDRTLLNSEALARPTLLITDSYNALVTQIRRPDRDTAFFENIKAALMSGGNVLVPVASTTRCLELTFLFETYWTKSTDLAHRFPHIYFLSPQSARVLHEARRTTEWMGAAISKMLSQQNQNVPFDFRHVRIIQHISELDSAFAHPKVVFASAASLETGPSRRLFFDWCSNSVNVVLLPERGDPGTIGRHLYEAWLGAEKKHEAVAVNLDLRLQFDETRRELLVGEELAEFQKAEEAKKEAAVAAAELAKLTAMDEDDSDDDAENDDPAAAARKLNALGAEKELGGFANTYDLYVKDGQRTGGFFKQSQSFRMFPVSNPRAWVDDYGEAVDPALFVNEEKAAMEQAAEEIPDVQVKDEEDTRDNAPSKYVQFSIDIHVVCKVIFIDLEGRSDGKSVKNILGQVAPRKLILIHGAEDATSDLEQYCLQTAALTNEVFAPHNNEWINVSAASDTYEIKLTDSLVSSLMSSKIGDYELSYVSGYIHFDDEERLDSMDLDAAAPVPDAPTAVVPTLDILPADIAKSYKPVLVGDVKLSEFRKVLVSKGFETEFVAGVLVVNRSIMIRKSQQGKLVLEGSMSPDYYACRKLLYAQHAIL